MSRRDAFHLGLLLEVDTVMAHAPSLKGMVCDSAAFDIRLWEERIKGPKPQGLSEYTETVRLIEAFKEVAAKAPEETSSVTFAHDQRTMTGNVTWICKVTAHVEDGLRCLTFTEEKKEAEHGC